MKNINKDLSVQVDDTILNIRVVILLESEKGYVFEESKDGYLFGLGGRVKLQESTIKACARELLEEVKLHDIEMIMAGVVENFFVMNGSKRYHEINFVFRAKLNQSLDVESLSPDDGNVGYVYVMPQDFGKHDIRPKALLDVINTDKSFIHVICKE